MPHWNRRHFLTTSTLTALASTTTARAAASEPVACGIGISTYGMQGMTLEAAIELVAETGYDCVEITSMEGYTGDPARVGKEQREKLRALIAEKKLRVCAMMTDLHPNADDAIHAKQTAMLRAIAELGRELSPEKVPLVQTVLAGKEWEASKELFRARLKDWVRVADEVGFTLAIKPHRMQAMSRPEDAIWLFRQLGEPARLRMVYDYSHFNRREPAMTIAKTVATSLPWTAYVASKDSALKDGKVGFALVGEGGEIDHAEIVKAFAEGGYRGDFGCEVSSQTWKAPGYDAVAATKVCYRNLRAAFDRAGVAQRGRR